MVGSADAAVALHAPLRGLSPGSSAALRARSIRQLRPAEHGRLTAGGRTRHGSSLLLLSAQAAQHGAVFHFDSAHWRPALCAGPA